MDVKRLFKIIAKSRFDKICVRLEVIRVRLEQVRVALAQVRVRLENRCSLNLVFVLSSRFAKPPLSKSNGLESLTFSRARSTTRTGGQVTLVEQASLSSCVRFCIPILRMTNLMCGTLLTKTSELPKAAA